MAPAPTTTMRPVWGELGLGSEGSDGAEVASGDVYVGPGVNEEGDERAADAAGGADHHDVLVL